MYLVINDAILPPFIALVKKERVAGCALESRHYNLLSLVDKIFNRAKIKPSQLMGIIVISEAESFSQSRIYATVANIFGVHFDQPRIFIRPLPKETIDQAINRAKKLLIKKNILPLYNREPNITKPGRRLGKN